jgi:hypothetical protein
MISGGTNKYKFIFLVDQSPKHAASVGTELPNMDLSEVNDSWCGQILRKLYVVPQKIDAIV